MKRNRDKERWETTILEDYVLEDPAKLNVSIGHVCFEVSNLAESRRFYQTALTSLGFKVMLEDKDAIGLGNGPCSIWLAKPELRRVQKAAPSADEFVIADHFALLLPDRRAVDKVVQALGKEGFKPLFAPEPHPEFHPGYYSASYCDNDNNVVEFYTMNGEQSR